MTSCIDLQIANIPFVLMSRNLEDAGEKLSPGQAGAHNSEMGLAKGPVFTERHTSFSAVCRAVWGGC